MPDYTPEQLAELGQVMLELSTSPKTRITTLESIKSIKPELSIPELDARMRAEEALKPMQARLEEMEKREREREVAERVAAGRKAALKVEGVKSADLEAIEKLMVEKHIPSHETAAELFAAQNRVAVPTTSHMRPPGRFETQKLPNAETLKEFGGNLRAYQRDQAYRAIDELRGRRFTS